MTELSVRGMTCGHCVRAVTSAIESVDPRAKVLIKALDDAGYPAAEEVSRAPAAPKKGSCCGCGSRPSQPDLQA